jgi:predicted metal-dependent peptidase
MGLRDELDQSVKTASTNGKVIKWSPTWLESLTEEELRFVLLHETLHCAHQHMWRLPADRSGNLAGDHEINLTLASITGISMPAGGCCDPAYRDLACEEILARLPPDPPGSGKGPGPDPCGAFVEPVQGQPGQGQPDLQEAWQIRVVQASIMATKTKGSVPADIQRELDRLRASAVDWRAEMADFVRSVISQRNDWSRSARRHAWQTVIYPRRRPDDVGLVVFARDTSGSIDNQMCAEFSAMVTAAMAETGCRGLVIDCDHKIQKEYWLEPGDECPVKAMGGGGTNFRPVFQRTEELATQGEQIAGVVYLTDLEGDFPDDPETPTLWLTKEPALAPFGRTVRIA